MKNSVSQKEKTKTVESLPNRLDQAEDKILELEDKVKELEHSDKEKIRK
jgi:hypothetical protein